MLTTKLRMIAPASNTCGVFGGLRIGRQRESEKERERGRGRERERERERER